VAAVAAFNRVVVNLVVLVAVAVVVLVAELRQTATSEITVVVVAVVVAALTLVVVVVARAQLVPVPRVLLVVRVVQVKIFLLGLVNLLVPHIVLVVVLAVLGMRSILLLRADRVVGGMVAPTTLPQQQVRQILVVAEAEAREAQTPLVLLAVRELFTLGLSNSENKFVY